MCLCNNFPHVSNNNIPHVSHAFPPRVGMCHNSMLPCGIFLLVHGLKGENFGIMVKYGKSGERVSEGKIVGSESQGGSL
jgi:hypothetical protein